MHTHMHAHTHARTHTYNNNENNNPKKVESLSKVIYNALNKDGVFYGVSAAVRQVCTVLYMW